MTSIDLDDGTGVRNENYHTSEDLKSQKGTAEVVEVILVKLTQMMLVNTSYGIFEGRQEAILCEI